MYKLLIVDDEPDIRDGMCKIIDWGNYGIEAAWTAGDGLEALKLIDSKRPDIVITDIKMPRCSGLELMEKAFRRGFHTKFIVLSGYEDYALVRASMKLGAVNYLLKPVNCDEMERTIDETILLIEQESHSIIRSRESLNALHDNTLNRLVYGQLDHHEAAEKLKILDIDLDIPNLRVALLKPLDVDGNKWLFPATLNICEELLNALTVSHLFIGRDDQVVAILGGAQALATEKVKQAFTHCTKVLKQALNLDCVVALGAAVSHLRELSPSFERAQRLLDYLAAFPQRHIISDEDLSDIGPDRPHEPAQVGMIAQLLLTKNTEGLIDYLTQRLYQPLNQTQPEIAFPVIYELIELLSFVLHVAVNIGLLPEDTRRIRQSLFADAYKIVVNEDLRQVTRRFIGNVMDDIQTKAQRSYSRLVEQALTYAEDNYGDIDISLKTLANRLGVNPAYLGRQFKEETGQYFSEHLKAERMRQAEKLLRGTDLSVAEVSKLTGFARANYFNQVFKHVMGMSPSDFRKSGNR